MQVLFVFNVSNTALCGVEIANTQVGLHKWLFASTSRQARRCRRSLLARYRTTCRCRSRSAAKEPRYKVQGVHCLGLEILWGKVDGSMSSRSMTAGV